MKKLKFTVINYDVSIFPMCCLTEALTQEFYKIAGINWSDLLIGLWQNRVNKFAGKRNDKAIARVMKNKFQKNPEFLSIVEEKIYKLCDELIGFSKKFKSENLKEKTGKEILDLYHGYIKRYKEMYLWGWVPNALEGEGNVFSQFLENYLRKKLKKNKRENLIGEYFSILMSSARGSVRQSAEKGMLEIASEVWKDEEYKNLIFERSREIKFFPNQEISRLSRRYVGVARKIIQHQEKYAWLEFNYEGRALTFEYFLNQLKNIIQSGQDPKILLQKIKNQQKEIGEKRAKYIKEIGLDWDKVTARFFEIGREMQYLKDYRKNILYESYYYLDFLIREIGRRLSLTPTQVRHILPREMEAALLQKEFSADELNERIKYSVLICPHTKQSCGVGVSEKGKIKIMSGSAAKKYIEKNIQKEEIAVDVKKLHGQCAYPGKTKGKVRLIFSTNDIDKIKNGDILVSIKTDPSLLPAMKKSSAIITEQGGITCHAAIIARELKIPCLVGVDLATKILKDNDSIEIDAGKGVIHKH